MATPKKTEPEWLIFSLALPLDYSAAYQVGARVASCTGAVTIATRALDGMGPTEVVGILCPDGRIDRVGPGCHLLPTSLRGALDRQGRVVITWLPS